MAAINSGNISNEYYYIDVLLTHQYKNFGQYELIENNDIIGELTDFDFTTQSQLTPFDFGQTSVAIITGYTTSKLKNVITYTGEYKVGVNGVTEVNNEYVSYVINDITYLTYLDTGITLYGFGKLTNEFSLQAILKDDNSVSIDVKKTLNALIIDRSNVSVYEYFNKMNNCNNLDDLLDIF
jgi:hypothetical protein